MALFQEINVLDPLLWWKTYCKDLSRMLLSAVSTSVSSERLFSGTGGTVTARSVRLNNDHVEMLKYIHDNINLSQQRINFLIVFLLNFLLVDSLKELKMFITHYFRRGGLAFEIMIEAYNAHHHSPCC